MKKNLLVLPILAIATLISCTHKFRNPSNDEAAVTPVATVASTNVALKYDLRRGSPAEYDAGAPADSKWIELYGSTPNYRSFGVEILGGQPKYDEKFRWVFGPMWYRGRLTPESVKVFVVGQEGAQDENVSNRAFTGSTGTRVQKFLNHLGIYQSYLFMNTFVYTINGQLEDAPEFKWIEQGEGSPVVTYRHKLFDYMLETNSQTVALFMGVGRGGKSSLATWINSRGGKCNPSADLRTCDTSGMAEWFKKNKNIEIKNKILAIGVPHPGGANPNLGGDEQLQNIIRGFTNAATRVATFKEENKDWLQADSQEQLKLDELIARMKSPFKYGHAPIPFRDFAFNTNWRMGSRGTTSNRWGADSIQVFSDVGVYNDKSSKFTKPTEQNSGLNAKKTALVEMTENDLAYESPRYNPGQNNLTYDFGPCAQSEKTCALSQALVSWPDLASVGIKSISHPSLGYFGTYRGRAKNAKVFILADQTSHDDFFSTRAITGADGQKLQSFLNVIATPQQYFIARTLPVDTLGVATTDLIKGALQPSMMETYQRIYSAVSDQSEIKIVIAIGPVAKAVIQNMKFSPQILTVPMEYSDTASTWNNSAATIANHLGQQKVGNYEGQLTTIPRIDLPYHTRWWMGSSGDRAARGEGSGLGNYYRVWAPYWVSQLYPKPLTLAEKSEVKSQMQSHLGEAVKATQGLEKDPAE